MVDQDGSYSFSKMLALNGKRQFSYVYPNPVVSFAEVKQLEGAVYFRIVNSFGVAVKTIRASSRIDLSLLQGGVYFLLQLDENQKIMESLKFVKR